MVREIVHNYVHISDLVLDTRVLSHRRSRLCRTLDAGQAVDRARYCVATEHREDGEYEHLKRLLQS